MQKKMANAITEPNAKKLNMLFTMPPFGVCHITPIVQVIKVRDDKSTIKPIAIFSNFFITFILVDKKDPFSRTPTINFGVCRHPPYLVLNGQTHYFLVLNERLVSPSFSTHSTPQFHITHIRM